MSLIIICVITATIFILFFISELRDKKIIDEAKEIYKESENILSEVREILNLSKQISRTAEEIVSAYNEEIEILKDSLCKCARNVGASASENCSIEFLSQIPDEVKLVVEKLKRENESIKNKAR